MEAFYTYEIFTYIFSSNKANFYYFYKFKRLIFSDKVPIWMYFVD